MRNITKIITLMAATIQPPEVLTSNKVYNFLTSILFFPPGKIINLLILHKMIKRFDQHRHDVIDGNPWLFSADLGHLQAGITARVDAQEGFEIHIDVERQAM